MLIFFDTRFISFVTLMGLLTIKNHFCTTFSGTDFTISFLEGICGGRWKLTQCRSEICGLTGDHSKKKCVPWLGYIFQRKVTERLEMF